MIDKALIQEKINSIQSDLERLKRFEDLTIDEIVADYYLHKSAERIIEVIVNEALDVNQHIISQEKGKMPPVEYRKTFLILGEINILPVDFAKQISGSAGLRNILVHQYRELDEELFYKSIKDCLRDYTKYCRHVLEYLENVDSEINSG